MDDTGIITYYHGKMIGFLIKKTFYDLWDNMFRIILLNLGFLASLAIPIFLPGFVSIPALSIALLAAGLLWCCLYLATASLVLRAVSDYGTFGFAEFLAKLKTCWLAGITWGIGAGILFLMARIVIPFYLNMHSLLGLFLAAIIFWTLVLAMVSFQFFFALYARMDGTIPIIVKKCFFLFLDNPGFAVFSLLSTILTLVLSLFLAFLLPGPAGTILFLDESLRLRLLKYEWQACKPPDHASVKRQVIPWDVILAEEKEKTGNRTLQSFIFPWKD